MVKKSIKLPETLEQKAGITSVEDKVNEIHKVLTANQPPPKKERKKRVLSEEQKQNLRERLVKAREVRSNKRIEKN